MGRRKKKKRQDAPEPAAAGWRARLRSPLLWIVAAGLVLRIAHLLVHKDDFWLRTALLDDNIFVSWADVIDKEGWKAASLGMFDFNPAYPYLLALIGKLFGRGYMAVFALQHVFGALVPAGLYLLCDRVFDRRTALLAGVLGALYGPSFFYESRFLGEFWIYLFDAGALLCVACAWRSERPVLWWALAGLSLGLALVFRPNVIFFLPPALAWAVWTLRERPKAAAASVLLFLFGCWLPLLPFQLRNCAVDPSQGWGLTTSSGGVNLYLGNNPEADGLNRAPSFVRYGPGHEYQDFKEEAERRTGRELDRAGVSSYWTGQVLDWFRRRPGRAALLMLVKAGFFWNHREPPDNFFLEVFRRFTRIGVLPLLSWGLVAPLGLAGLLWSLGRREGRSFWVLHAFVLSYFAVNVLFYILSRYRFPAAAGLIPFAAYALARLSEAWNSGAQRRLFALGATALLCLGVTRIPLIGEEEAAVSHYSMAVIYANQGWRDKAVDEYRASIRADADFKASYLNLGILQAERGELRESLWALENCLRLESDPKKKRALEDNIRVLRARLPKSSAAQ